MSYTEFSGALDEDGGGFVPFSGELDEAVPIGDPLTRITPSAPQSGGSGLVITRPKSGSVLDKQEAGPDEVDFSNRLLSTRRGAERSTNPSLLAPSIGKARGKLIAPTDAGVLSRGMDLAGASMREATAGASTLAADAVGAVGADDAANTLRRAASGARRMAQETQLANKFTTDVAQADRFSTGLEKFGTKYGPQIVAQMPQVGMAMLTGGIALPAALTAFGSYDTARQNGIDPANAVVYALGQGTAEALGEKVGGMGKLANAFESAVKEGFGRNALTTLGHRMASAGLKEVPSELATYTAQFGMDMGAGIEKNDDKLGERFLEGAKDTAIVAAGTGGLIGGGGAGVSMAASRREPERIPTAAELVERHWGVQKTPEQTAATVMSAGTVEDAIAAAEQETSAALPVVPSRPQTAAPAAVSEPAVNPQASAAVDRIGQILGQPQESPDASLPVGTPAQPAISGGSGGAVDVGSLDNRGLQPSNAGRGNGAIADVPVASSAAPVAAGVANAGGSASLEPAATWVGRRGDGYATQEDAEAAIPSRQRARADLDWKIEPTAEGRFRLAGYGNAVAETATNVASEATTSPQGFRFTVNPSGTVTVQGDQQAIRSTLTNAGVTQFAPGTSGVMVGRSQAQQAVQALQALDPQVRETTQRIQAMEQAAPAPAQPSAETPYYAVNPATNERMPLASPEEAGAKFKRLYEATGGRIPTIDIYEATTGQPAFNMKPDGSFTPVETREQALARSERMAAQFGADGLRALGATEEEIANAEIEVARERASAQQNSDGGGRPVKAVSGQAQVVDRGREGEARSEGLTSPTPEEVVAQQDRRQQGEREEVQRRTEEESRAKADAERGDFTLAGSNRVADSNPAQRDAFDAGMEARPFDHGELNIPGRTNRIDADLDRYKAEQAKAQKANAKQATAKRKTDKAQAKEVFAEVWPAMLEKMGPKFSEKQLRETLDSMVKWEPAKFLAMAEKFRKEQGGKDAFDSVMRHRAFHGSPHDFDKFTTEKIGTGEGAQAFGFGLYFAENEVVADGYRKNLSENAGTVDGQKLEERNPAHIAAGSLYGHNGDRAAAAADLRDSASKAWMFPAGADQIYKAAASLLESDAAVGKYEPGTGALYQVEIPDEVVAGMLLWDTPLDMQPDAVKQALQGLNGPARELAFRADGELRSLAGNDFYERLAEELSNAPDEMDDPGPRGWGGFTQTINDRVQDQRAASQKLESLGIPGIRYLDGGSRNRPLKQVKKEFLAQLPEDADFNEVLDLIGSGSFSPQNEAILTALAENDWLGFDYPAQAISAALSNKLSNYDASPALVKAVEDAQKDATYNLVVFNDKNVTITHKDGSPVTKKERDDFLDEALGRGGISQEQRDANFRRWSNDAPLVKSADADTYAFKTGHKVVLEAFHGTKRPDRVGEVFQRKRATSGPMAFFTSAPVLASSYAQGKADTSLSYEDQDYAAWFKYKPQSARTPVDIVRSFYFLPQETRERIAELAPRVMTDDTGENLILGPEGHTTGNGGYDQALVESRRGSYDRQGNPLKALVDAWLNSAALFNEEERFLEVLKLAGFPVSEVIYDNPNSEYPAVYKAFVFMQQPLVTNDIPGDLILALQAAAKRDRSRAADGGADMWDKNTRTLREWVKALTEPQNGSAQYVWTSIPDKVTEVFKSLGYDGIIDWSGKGGGTMHPVYIPFSETQVKSATGNRGTFDADSKNILRRRGSGDEPTAKQSARTAEVQKTVDELSAKWTDGPDIEVVASVADLPGNHPADTRGMYQSGKVWIVADAYAHGSRKGIAKTLAHEVVAHHGLRKILGRDDWNRLMSNIQLAIKAKNKPLSALRDEVREAYKDEDGNYDLSPAQEADEITALAVEQAIDADGNFRPGFGMFKAAFAKVAQFLRDIGLDVAFTNAELQGMLVLSMRGLQAGQRTEGGGRMVMGGSTAARSQRSALQELSEADEVFALPKSDKDTVKGIAADVAPRVIVSAGKTVGLSTTYTLLDAQGGKAKLTVRKPNPYGPSVYSFESGESGLKSDDERPGVNPYDVSPDVEDVYLDISDSKPGSGFGEIAYGIAANFAHNTDRIFIGDPNGLSDVAMRRRLEQMISSAIKFGTTAHIAPHPRQVAGDKRLGIPSLRWVYGDHEGNIERMIDASRQALAAAFPSSKLIEYRDGEFYRTDTGQRFANRRQLAGVVGQSIAERRARDGGQGAAGYAGWRTLARNALFSHLQSTADGEPGQRGRLLDRLRTELPRIGRDQSTGGTFEAKDRIFYARGGVSDQTDTPAFKKWFGDSKVVDAAGKPLVVYHGAPDARFVQDDGTFKTIQEKYGGQSPDGGAHWFAADLAVAKTYAKDTRAFDYQNADPGIVAAYLKLENPLIVDGGGRPWREAQRVGKTSDVIEKAKAEGHDGVIIRNVKDDYNNENGGRRATDTYVVWRSTQIKSATENNGAFDPFDADIRHARSTTADTEQDSEEEAPATSPTSPWRDSTGRLQFAPGVWLYEKLGQAASPMLTKLQLKTASPELKRALREMKLQVAKAQETAGAVATEAMKLTEAERAMVSDLVEQELAAGTIPPAHALRLAAMINTTMGAQTDELVRLGMLTAESADIWRGKYLPRYYKNKLGKQVGDAWADAVQKMFGRTRAMAGIKGKHLRGRGLYETVQASEVAEWESLGWEVRDSDYPGADSSEISQKILADELSPNDTVQVWRDFTREERDSMGEIRDAGFRFVLGYMQTQKDIALGQLFEHLAGNTEMSGKKETAEFTIRVPDGTVTGTGAKRYGKLSGMWVSKDTFSHLSQIEESQSEAWQMYRKALGIWKEGRVVLNPVSHVNNIVSNLSMAHFAGVSYLRGDKYIAAARDLATKAAGVIEAKEAGLFLGTLSDAELMNVLPEDLKALVKQQDSAAKKIGSSAFNMLTFFLRRPMGWAYQAEDTFFRYLIYKDARERGLEPGDAVDYAQKYIFTYDDLPKGARMIRDFGVPFFAYTYKAVPALLHTAMTHPIRMAAPAAVLWGINAAAYAIAAGDDEDDWLDTLQKYITDSDFRAKVKEKEQLEREHLPPWMKGSTSLGTPKAIRLGMDEVTKLPLFIDTSRIVPGGDLFDMHSNGGGIPWIQPLTPSNPILTTYMAMFGNKDAWFGKEIVDSNDTRGEAAAKRAEWLWKQATPAVAAGNYHFERGMNALAQASGGEIKWLPEAVSERYTGIGRDALPVQPKLAVAQTFGIKVRPMDLDKSEAIGESMKKKMIRDIDAEMRSLLRLNKIGAVSDKVYDRKDEESRVKKERLKDGMTVDGEKKD